MLNRRDAIKRVAVVGAVTVVAPSLLTACGSTKNLVKWATFVLQYLRDLLPILTDIQAVKIVALINKALPIAEKLKKALEDNDNVGTFEALQNLTSPTGVIAEIAQEVGLLTDPDKRRIILGILAAVQLTLRLIAAQIDTDVPVATKATVRAARPQAASAVENAARAAQIEAAFRATKF